MPEPLPNITASPIPGGIQWSSTGVVVRIFDAGMVDVSGELSPIGFIYLPFGTYLVRAYNQTGGIRGAYVTVVEYGPSISTAYSAHTAICFDLAVPGAPITTLGIKAVDTHVNALDQAFLLVGYGTDSESPQPIHVPLIQADTGFGNQFIPDFTLPPLATNPTIYTFNSSRQNVPIRYLSPDINFDARHERKRFRFIEFHGRGTAAVRVFVDGRLINSGNVCATEDPSHQRKFMLPRGTRGYTLKLEVAGLIDIRLIEVAYEPMPWTS